MSIINMNPMPVQNQPLMLRIWPDNTWTIVEDIREGEYAHMSDDFTDIDFFDVPKFTTLPQELQDEIELEVMGENPSEIEMSDSDMRHLNPEN